MNTLTKSVLVLLAVLSFFLCGSVVTYLAHADNYKAMYQDERRAKQNAVSRMSSAEKQLNEKTAQYAETVTELEGEIDSLNNKVADLASDLKKVDEQKKDLELEVRKSLSLTEELTKTNADKQALLEQLRAELIDVKSKQMKQQKQLDETVADLVEKNAIIQTLVADKKRLEEEKIGLERQMNRMLGQVGKETAIMPKVYPDVDKAQPVPTMDREIGLNGTITGVLLKYALAEISLGRAHGVQEGMRFYVTRGEQFVGEVVIFYVEAEKAVGDLKRVQLEPRVGDSVTTNL